MVTQTVVGFLGFDLAIFLMIQTVKLDCPPEIPQDTFLILYDGTSLDVL